MAKVPFGPRRESQKRYCAQKREPFMSSTTLGTGPERCARCGMVAVGFARIHDDRYCHGDSPGLTCYELASNPLRRNERAPFAPSMSVLALNERLKALGLPT